MGRIFSRRARHLAVLCAVLAACGGSPPPEPPPILDISNIGDVDHEIVELVEDKVAATRAVPTDATRRRDLAMALEANKLYGEARIAWEAALALNPDEVLWRFHHAETVKWSGDVPEALELMRGVVADRPSLAAAQFSLARMLIENGEFEAAEPCLRVAMSRQPQHPAPPTAMAELNLQLDRLDEAERFARQAVGIAPDYAEGHFVLGKVLRARGDMVGAQRELALGANAKTAFLSSPLKPEFDKLERGFTVRNSEATSLLESGRPDLAAPLLEALVRDYPDDVAAAVNLGVAYTHMNESEKAREHLLSLVDRFPDQASVYINLAAAEINLDMRLEAMQHVNKAIELAPELGRSYLAKAQMYTDMGRHREAYDTLFEAHRLDTNDAQILVKLGNAAWMLEDRELALQHFEQCVALDPRNQRALLNISMLSIASGRSARAQQAYADAKAIDPNSAFIKDFERKYGSGAKGGAR